MANDEKKDYMKENKNTMQPSTNRKEGIEEPRVTGMNKVKVGVIIFVILVIIVIIIGVSNDMWGLMN
ncbi:hypothetical protein [Planococcus sp. YIM B11945]|uniref:hypothetical protein n=1 Tax=Planococcus sp. YIM B11945 TaxID=3435410 RepID=UPI003D7DC47B